MHAPALHAPALLPLLLLTVVVVVMLDAKELFVEWELLVVLALTLTWCGYSCCCWEERAARYK